MPKIGIERLQVAIDYLSSIISPINWTPIDSSDLHFLSVELRHKIALAKKERDKFASAITGAEGIYEEIKDNDSNN